MPIFQYGPCIYKQEQTFTGTSSGETFDLGNMPIKSFAIQVDATGAVVSWSVNLEVSVDGTNFTTLVTHTNIIGNKIILYSTSSAPALYFRARCSSLVLGLGTNIKATIIGSN